jgi:hypothetical protein
MFRSKRTFAVRIPVLEQYPDNRKRNKVLEVLEVLR